MVEQKIITNQNEYKALDEWIYTSDIGRLLLVCGDSFRFQKKLGEHLKTIKDKLELKITTFSDFKPNPIYENVVDGVRLFRKEKCDGIMAVGGGSAIDVAKCIKLYSNMKGNGEGGDFLKQKGVLNDIPFLAMPTTAGTGSEATRYAVIYYGGKKQSITSDTIMPDVVLMDPDCLATLPLYQKKAAMMDALCHAIESYWSVNSTDESKRYSRKAIRTILDNMDAYLDVHDCEESRRNMLLAANMAGKAINITQTTAGHAMCYKLTSMFGVAHGHAAVLCNRILYQWMIDNTDRCIDPRGEKYIKKAFDEIGQAMGCADAAEGARRLEKIFDLLELSIPGANEKQIEALKTGVNPDRLKNNPVGLDVETIDLMYHRICDCSR